MTIKYHVAVNWSQEKIEIVNKFGIYPKIGFTAVQIEEEKYILVLEYLKRWGGKGIRYPEFTKQELKDSLLSAKSGGHEHSYPMPDMNNGYKDLTYDLSDYCPKCGIGLKQKDAFRLKNVPAEGKKQVFSLGWINDELFVEKSIYDKIFLPLGIKQKEVLIYKKEIPFENTVQLILEETEEKLDLEANPIEVCNTCERTKYQPMPQGFYPMYKNIIAPIFKSYDYFGSGAAAGKRIFIAEDLREKLIDTKIEKATWYTPTK